MLFINYRRDDTRYLARALADALRVRFGPDYVFMDESSIAEGSEWTEAIQNALRQAKVVLTLIGPSWLRFADKYGRRRLDDDEDWVRKELVLAKERGIKILPILVGGNDTMPESAGLPKCLDWLPGLQKRTINDNNWYADVKDLQDALSNEPALVGSDFRVPLPVAPPHMLKVQELTPEAVLERLAGLDGWDPVKSIYPPRQELRKVYMFRSFGQAIRFMNFATPKINENGHHPRWENQFRTVTIYFSTWDARSQITQHDIGAAELMDRWYEEYRAGSGAGI